MYDNQVMSVPCEPQCPVNVLGELNEMVSILRESQEMLKASVRMIDSKQDLGNDQKVSNDNESSDVKTLLSKIKRIARENMELSHYIAQQM